MQGNVEEILDRGIQDYMNNKGESEKSISDQSKTTCSENEEELESSGVNKGNKGRHWKGNMRNDQKRGRIK